MDKLNILVVEDGQSQREMLKDFFPKKDTWLREPRMGILR